jgi:NitT/TauT family transport system substrate-binding protein
MPTVRCIDRRAFLRIAGLGAAAGLLTACAPAAQPSPTAAPAKPAADTKPAADAKPTAAAKPAAKAEPAASPAAKPAAAASPVVKAAAPPEVKDLKVGILPIAALTPPVVANKLGYFKEAGFNSIEFTTLGGGAELLPAVEAGRIDLALSAYYSVYLARQGGFNFWIACNNDSATNGPTDGYAVVVKSDSPIQSVKELEGKRVATNTVPSLGIGYLAALMKKEGADYQKINFLEIGFPQMPDAVFNNQVDAANMLEPGHTVAVSSGRGRAIGYPYVQVHPGVDLGGFIATERWLRQNPISAERFTQALTRGVEYMNADEARARREVIEFTKLDPAVAEKMHLPVWRTKVDPAKAQLTADLMLELGMLREKQDVAKFVWQTAL